MPPEGGAIYDVAFTHRSFAYEQPEPAPHNERLEFLGDAILGAVVTRLIFDRYPFLAEGEMARLRASVVNTLALADLGRRLGVGAHIRLGKGEEASGGRAKASLLADTLEALIGAVYLDRGIEAVTAALDPLFEGQLGSLVAGGERYDVKTALQELVVRARTTVPEYRLSSSGPDHDKRFRADVFVADELLGTGEGKSKKAAEQEAARRALEVLRKASPPEGHEDDCGGAETGARAS